MRETAAPQAFLVHHEELCAAVKGAIGAQGRHHTDCLNNCQYSAFPQRFLIRTHIPTQNEKGTPFLRCPIR